MCDEVDAVTTIERLLVGPHVGIVEQMLHARPDPDDLPLEVFAARVADLGAVEVLWSGSEVSGAALTERAARLACLGEAVERYAAGLPAPGAVRHASIRELPEAVPPTAFAMFSPRQYRQARHAFPFQCWRPEDRLGWVQGSDLATGDAIWVPAQFVYQPYRLAPAEPLLGPGLSTGLACGATREEAALVGLCEVIERDAVALAWLASLAPAVVRRTTLSSDQPLRRMTEMLDDRGLRWTLFDLTTEFAIPVFAALLEGHSALGRVISFGSACRPQPRGAALKALIEAAHGRMFVKSLLRREPDWNAGRRFRNVTRFADHARFHSVHPEYRASLERWWSSSCVVDWVPDNRTPWTEEHTVVDLARQVRGAGWKAILVELTPPDIAELGWHVVRVVVPGLQPLHGHHGWPHLGGPRLARAGECFQRTAHRHGRLNSIPHPCP